jgi:hypothetical protein
MRTESAERSEVKLKAFKLRSMLYVVVRLGVEAEVDSSVADCAGAFDKRVSVRQTLRHHTSSPTMACRVCNAVATLIEDRRPDLRHLAQTLTPTDDLVR